MKVAFINESENINAATVHENVWSLPWWCAHVANTGSQAGSSQKQEILPRRGRGLEDPYPHSPANPCKLG